MTHTWRVLSAASRLRQRFVGLDGYGLVYGSHAAGTAEEASDLDLVLITTEQISAGRLSRLVDAVCQLHYDHGLALDTEVDHAAKVHATCDDVAAAVSLHCFPADVNGRLEVPPVIVEPWFLNSEPFRLRLLLNALTSPHIFLGGSITLFDEHCRRSERALALLALSLHDGAAMTLAEAIALLTECSTGAQGKDFLGYAPGAHLYTVLHCGLGRLRAEGVVRDREGSRFEWDSAAVQALFAQLRPRSPAERDAPTAPETMAPDA